MLEMIEVAFSDVATEAIDIGVLEQFFSELPDKMLHFGVRILLAIAVFFVGTKLIKVLRKMVKKALQKGNAEQGVIQFLDSFIKIALYLVLVLIIATSFGVDAASVIAVIGSAGVAIGLALQGSLSNLAGGVLILLMKPFKVGDYIKEDTNGNEGTVEEIQLFYTRLVTAENKIIVLPNGTLANSSLTNVTFAPIRRVDIAVGISYNADIKKAKEVLVNVLKDEALVMKDKEHFAYVDSLGDSGVNMGVRCWVKNENYWEAKWKLTEDIKYALDENAIEIPYPQLDVHLEQGK